VDFYKSIIPDLLHPSAAIIDVAVYGNACFGAGFDVVPVESVEVVVFHFGVPLSFICLYYTPN